MNLISVEKQRHTLSHILAMAVGNIYEDVKYGIGPAIENGFYYDFEFTTPIKEEDLLKIEKEMRKIIKEKYNLKASSVSKKEAKKLFATQPYKLELIDGISDENVSIYQIGENGFLDLCSGPHVDNTGLVGAFKLDRLAGAYWKGDEKNAMLQRIYGLAFETKEVLDRHIKIQEELRRRDHRKLGKELKLFMTDPEIGAGLIMWLPRGAFLRKKIMEFALDTYLQNGYDPVSTPHIAKLNLWKTSGHWSFYRDSMYEPFGVDKEKYVLKPMNCPFHVVMYNSEKRSYRDLPIRWTEMGTVYRYEKSGQLSGLTRVRGFTQDDAHIICTPSQLEGEVEKALDLTMYILKKFGFRKYELNLSTHDPQNSSKYIGETKIWEEVEDKLRSIAKRKGYGIVEDPGEAAFYGPKLDLKVEDVFGRKIQLSTIQVDFNLPERFGMGYTDKDGKEKQPIMIHRALLGSLERFIAILIENYGGIFPLWLCHEQVRIIPINDTFAIYAEKVKDELMKGGFRVKVDERSETMQKKIREAELEKIPYMLIVGEKERTTKTVSVRSLKEKGQGLMKLSEFVNILNKQIESE